MIRLFLLCIMASVAWTFGAQEDIQMPGGGDFHGGLMVIAGCEDAQQLLLPAKNANTLVHGLVRERPTLQAMRERVQLADGYGRASAMLWESPYLPHADGMVNLLLVNDEQLASDPAEIDRVLAPLGVAWIQGRDSLKKYRKPWPADVDQWSHSRYDATGNAVSKDQLAGPPRYLQWEALPRWNRGTKTSCLVTMQGRIFYILDDSHFAAGPQTWSLVARDAGNGIQLWRHRLPSWGGARGGKKVGPAQVHRRLVADEGRVFVTLGEFAPVSVLDAKNGEVLRTLTSTERAEEILLSAGVLVALVNPNTPAGRRRGKGRSMQLVAVNPGNGRMLWTHPSKMIMPLTMAADGKQVVYHDGRVIRSLDLKTGVPRWTSPPTGQKIVHRDRSHPDSPGAEPSTIVLAPQFAPTLIIYGDVVAFAGGRQLNVMSAKDGKERWRSAYAATNYSVPVDLFGYGGVLWGPDPGMNLWRPLDDNIDFNAYDPMTGTVTKQVKGKYGFRFQHHRCHQMKMVGGKVVAARAGIEFLDTENGKVEAHHWIRGSCFYGILPANGRIYVPPHNCACYVRAKLSGFMALNHGAPLRESRIDENRRLVQGPAFGAAASRPSESDISPDDWPTYRHDAARSGGTKTRVCPTLLLGWKASVGGRLTSPVVADNRVYLASTDAHTLHAFNAETGEPAWRSTFNGRIDSPPTVYRGLVLCGCRDGSVHALRAGDGALAWRFMAAPCERLIVSRGQLESVWPVSGSVLVVNDTVYFAAGKSSYLDGGIRFFGLDPMTGRKRLETVLSARKADGSETLDEQGVDGCRSDILSSNGRGIFMRHKALDLAGKPLSEPTSHLHSPDGFLSWDATSRLLWTYAPMFTSPHQGAFYDVRLSRVLFPSGRILVEDGDTVFGFGQNHYQRLQTEPGGQWALFAAFKASDVPLHLTAVEYKKLALARKHSVKFRWWKRVPIQVWALVKTPDILFAAGPRGSESISSDALEGRTGALLLAVNPKTGDVVNEMPLPSAPVWDGMAAANGSLYLSLTDGDILCYRRPHAFRTFK